MKPVVYVNVNVDFYSASSLN